MIYLRAKGGEDLPVFINRAHQLAVAASDIVLAKFHGVQLTIHPTFAETVVAFYNEKKSHKEPPFEE